MSIPPNSPYGPGVGSGGAQSGAGTPYPQGQYDQSQPGGYPQGGYQQQAGYQDPGYGQQAGYQDPGYGQQQAGYASSGYGQPTGAPNPGGSGSYPAAPPKRTQPWVVPVIVIATLLGGLGIGYFVKASESPPAPSALPAATVTATETAAPETERVTVTAKATATSRSTSKTPLIRDGVWKIGTQIMPGLYVTLVPDDSAGCYVAFLSSSNKSDVIKEGTGKAGNFYKVQVPSPSEAAYFYSRGCGIWLASGS